MQSNTGFSSSIKLVFLDKPFYLTLILFLFLSPFSLFAEGSGNNVLLQKYDLNTAQSLVQAELIKQITVTNVIKNNSPYKVSVEPGSVGGNVVNVTALQRTEAASPVSRRAAPAPRPQSAARGASSTNVREKGVDEADLVKTDGRYLYSLGSLSKNGQRNGQKNGLRIYDTQYKGKRLAQLTSVSFEKGLQLKGLYLLAAQQKLVVVAEMYRNRVRKKNWGGNTRLIYIDIHNKSKPRITKRVNLEGTTRSSKRIGSQLYLVLNSHSFRLPPTNKTIESGKPITAEQYKNEKQRLINIIKAWRINEQLPHYSEVGKQGTQSLLTSGQFYLNTEAIRSYSLTALLAIDLNSPHFRPRSTAFFGSPSTVYVSPKSMYLTSYYNDNKKTLDVNSFPRQSAKTLIHKFALSGSQLTYRGSGVVLGQLGWSNLSTFQLDEDKHGNLRVVTYNWNAQNKNNKSNDPATRSPVVLTALKEQEGKLTVLSRLPNRYYPEPLGKKGERLYGARLFDDYAYFVTFRQTDPLYVVDMRNPRSMKISGKLVIPGFSNYLHPINKDLLLGIGSEVEIRKDGRVGRTKGLKLSLFDIRNPTQPREVSKVVIGGDNSSTPVSSDYHALTTLKVGNSGFTRVLMPATLAKKDAKNGHRYEAGLQQIEVDARTKKISYLGEIKANKGQKKWNWSYNDRSIMIGERVFYFHQGQFQEAPWRGIIQKQG